MRILVCAKIKLDNFMFDSSTGLVKLLDFGLVIALTVDICLLPLICCCYSAAVTLLAHVYLYLIGLQCVYIYL